MKSKLKECSRCKQQKPIWKAKSGDMGAFCKDCYIIHQKTLESRSDGLKLGKIKMYSLKQWKERKKISPISKKKAKELVEYRKLRDEYMKEHPICEVKGCGNRGDDLHHKKPRAYHLLDVSVYMAVCRPCHEKIEREDNWARENGYKLNHL